MSHHPLSVFCWFPATMAIMHISLYTHSRPVKASAVVSASYSSWCAEAFTQAWYVTKLHRCLQGNHQVVLLQQGYKLCFHNHHDLWQQPVEVHLCSITSGRWFLQLWTKLSLVFPFVVVWMSLDPGMSWAFCYGLWRPPWTPIKWSHTATLSNVMCMGPLCSDLYHHVQL